MSECTYSLIQVAFTHSFLAGAGFAVVWFATKALLKCKDENGKVGRGKDGKFKSKKCH